MSSTTMKLKRAEDVVVDPGPAEGLGVRVPVEEELVVVRPPVVAADVLHPARPLEQAAVHARRDELGRVLAQGPGIELRLERRVDVREVVRARDPEGRRELLVALVRRVERHDRVLVGVGVVAQRLGVLGVVRDEALDERHEVLLVLPLDPLAVRGQLVLEDLARPVTDDLGHRLDGRVTPVAGRVGDRRAVGLVEPIPGDVAAAGVPPGEVISDWTSAASSARS